jgi:hypothetical protein
MKEELQWKAIEEGNSTIKWGGWMDSVTSVEEGWPGVSSDAAWPTLEVGVEVSVEVHSEVGSLRGDSACRSLMIIECFSVSNLLSLLCHSTIGTSLGSCPPSDRSHRGSYLFVISCQYASYCLERGSWY